MISARRRCESHESIDLAWLSSSGTYDHHSPRVWTYSSGLKIAAYPEPWAVVLEVAERSHRIALTYTTTRFGGRRPWFSCPHCQSARRVLYLGHRGFACRSCLDLRYASQIEDEISRWARRRSRLRESLGGELNAPLPLRPKHMQWKTYRAIEAKDRQLEQGALTALAARAGRFIRAPNGADKS